ncbi:MAG: hypothetical protein J5994_11315 [Ruminococcus sp.]|nr:hypothetical protein [Ruminococcus sp.]
MQNTKKKRFVIIAVTACLMISAAAAGISLATLTADTEKRANVFTFGNVDIDLEEPNWDDQNNIVYPGKAIAKDPVVRNTGRNDLYAYIEVKVPKRSVRTVENTDGRDVIRDAALQELFSYNVSDKWTEISREPDKEIDGEVYDVYLYAYNEVLTSGGVTDPPLFNEVKYINMLEGEIEMDTVIEMPITAYAIQSDYLGESGEDLKQKMTDAFNKYKSQIDG